MSGGVGECNGGKSEDFWVLSFPAYVVPTT